MKNIFLDEAGRMKDDKGNIINLKPKAVSVLKVNINRQKEERVKAMLRHQKGTSMASKVLPQKRKKHLDMKLLRIIRIVCIAISTSLLLSPIITHNTVPILKLSTKWEF